MKRQNFLLRSKTTDALRFQASLLRLWLTALLPTLLVCCSPVNGAPGVCPALTFEAARTFSVEGYAGSVAVSDFNADGKPDLAVGNLSYDEFTQTYTNGGVSVLLGKGDGTFQVAVNYRTGTNPDFVAAGDFNGDGKPDLIVVGNGISLLFGKGDGTFQAAVTLQAPAAHAIVHQDAVAPGDFNGDGKLDFVTTYVDGIGSGAVVWLNTSCSSGPNLTIARTGPGLTLSWPFPSAGYVLESSTNLNPTSWRPAETLPVNNNGQWEVTTPTTQRQGYLRLRKP